LSFLEIFCEKCSKKIQVALGKISTHNLEKK